MTTERKRASAIGHEETVGSAAKIAGKPTFVFPKAFT